MNWCVMVSSNHCTRTRTEISDYSPAVFVPHFVYLLQLVSIDPLDLNLVILYVMFCSDFDEGSDK
jgi:hypothetical protein